MAYLGQDGILRGKRGGYSSKNSYEVWRKHFGTSKRKKTVNPVDVIPDQKDITAYGEYVMVKDLQQHRNFYESRGYNPDDPHVDRQMQLDAEDESEYYDY